MFAMLSMPMESQVNGIGVSPPKVFDDRSLTIMSQQLSDQLRSVQVVDQTKLAASLGLLQGFQSKDTSQALTVSTPFSTTKQTFDANNTPTGTEKDTTIGGTGTPPVLPNLQADPSGFAPQYGSSAEDLLSDQVNLSYKLFNIRMLLERSLTDRLWASAPAANPPTSQPRLQAIIGFNVSVSPPRFAKGKAAVIMVELTPRKGSGSASLVALMPQEKTYNSAALSKSASAFGGSAVIKVVTVGYNYQRRNETLYLFRDADTVSFEDRGTQNDGGTLRFGWEFRPVLGRKSVSPGMRQMFAVVAMPDGDGYSTHTDSGFPYSVKVHTYWKSYDRNNLTTKAQEVSPRDATFEGSVPYTEQSQSALGPKVRHVSWSPTGPETAVVTVQGENFFPGTSLLLGKQTYSTQADGLLLKSDQSLQLTTTIAALGGGEIVLNGRYGSSRLLIPDASVNPGILINEMSLDSNPARQQWPLSLKIQSRDGSALDFASVIHATDRPDPIITVAGKFVQGPYHYQPSTCKVPLPPPTGGTQDRACVLVQVLVPADVVKSEAAVQIRFPLLGPTWSDSQPYYDPAQVLKVVRVGTGSKSSLAISGESFDESSTVQLDRIYHVRPGELYLADSHLLTMYVDSATLAQYKSLVVFPHGTGTARLLDIPPSKPDPIKAKLDGAQQASAQVGSAPSVTFTGTGLSAITVVKFGYEELTFKVADDGKSIQVFLSRRVTQKEGPVQILLSDASGTLTPASVSISGRPQIEVKKP